VRLNDCANFDKTFLLKLKVVGHRFGHVDWTENHIEDVIGQLVVHLNAIDLGVVLADVSRTRVDEPEATIRGASIKICQCSKFIQNTRITHLKLP